MFNQRTWGYYSLASLKISTVRGEVLVGNIRAFKSFYCTVKLLFLNTAKYNWNNLQPYYHGTFLFSFSVFHEFYILYYIFL